MRPVSVLLRCRSPAGCARTTTAPRRHTRLDRSRFSIRSDAAAALLLLLDVCSTTGAASLSLLLLRIRFRSATATAAGLSLLLLLRVRCSALVLAWWCPVRESAFVAKLAASLLLKVPARLGRRLDLLSRADGLHVQSALVVSRRLTERLTENETERLRQLRGCLKKKVCGLFSVPSDKLVVSRRLTERLTGNETERLRQLRRCLKKKACGLVTSWSARPTGGRGAFVCHVGSQSG